ncbi:MAG: 50S ribosome-binding GTPase, partial [Actinomycetota bacterium]|nr:50S ribosome-binding GTPase [Actinomycetota bacterium]
MALDVGIVGLPAAGKTTVFTALTGVPGAPAKANVGMAPIPDSRLEDVARTVGSPKATPASMRVTDLPGTGEAVLN